jgi:hypothetical protein
VLSRGSETYFATYGREKLVSCRVCLRFGAAKFGQLPDDGENREVVRLLGIGLPAAPTIPLKPRKALDHQPPFLWARY